MFEEVTRNLCAFFFTFHENEGSAFVFTKPCWILDMRLVSRVDFENAEKCVVSGYTPF